MAGKPALLIALEALKNHDQGDPDALAEAFQCCRVAPDEVHYAHVLYNEISEIAIHYRQWHTAEEFAIKALIQLPSSGAALRLLGSALQGQGRIADAAICHRYGLPLSVRQKYFSDIAINITRSEDTASVESLTAHPAQNMPLAPPLSIDGETIWELSINELSSSAAQTYRLHGARLWFDGFNTIVWDCNGDIISDISRGFPELVQQSLGSRASRPLPGKTCVLANRNSDNYYHWMNDILPRVHVLSRSGVNPNSIDQFVINPLQHGFQQETLTQVGIERSRLRFVDNEYYFHCEELLIPVYGSNTLGKEQAPWNPAFLKSTFLPKRSSQTRDRLYISRKKANGRSIQNEEELVSHLSKRGFQRVFLEGLRVQDQAILFNDAAVVLGSHGAGLSNIAFCEPETTVIELYEQHIAPCFWITSEMTGLRHAVHYCGDQLLSSLTPKDDLYYQSAENRRLSNFKVDITRLAQLLDMLEIT